jgi:hypothetical protein
MCLGGRQSWDGSQTNSGEITGKKGGKNLSKRIVA